jgi:hypothetical protein
MTSPRTWSPERRAKQADLIRVTKPWLSSTGPRTSAGKLISARNAAKPEAVRHELLAILANIRRTKKMVKEIIIKRYGRRRYYA